MTLCVYIYWDLLLYFLGCTVFYLCGDRYNKISPYFITLLYWVSKPKVVPSLRSIPALSPVRFMVQVQFLDETFNGLAGKFTGNHCFPFSPSKEKRPSAVCFSLETNPMKHGEISKKRMMLGIETLKNNIIRMELNAETNMWWCEDYDWLCPANGHMGLSFWWLVILGIEPGWIGFWVIKHIN